MNIAELSVKRPVTITCLAFLVVVLGLMAIKKMPVDLFPDVTFPIIAIHTPYPGAGPREVENLVSRVIEEQVSTISGIKSVYSESKEGLSTVITEFELKTDIKDAEQQVRNRLGIARPKLPDDVEEPILYRVDPASQPIAILALQSKLPPAELYELATETVKPQLENIDKVGLVEVVGGRKREIHVHLDRQKLKQADLSVSGIALRMNSAGLNIPAGKIDDQSQEIIFKTLGEFKKVEDVENVTVSFFGNDNPLKLSQLGTIEDGLTEEKSRVYVNGKPGIFLMLFKQTGANTVAILDALNTKTLELNKRLAATDQGELNLVRDGAKAIRANILDVEESILIGVLLTILVVFFFLGSLKSTFITGLALPYSLIGAFILMGAFGFSINLMTLLAISLSVGLVIDDAIVVRENIFRQMELGLPPMRAAIVGTREVTLAVLATTFTVLAVFGPVGFLDGVVGQFFKQFGLTVCFAMLISLLDAFTMAPMLSAYYGGHSKNSGFFSRMENGFQNFFGSFHQKLAKFYEKVLRNIVLPHPLLTIFCGFGFAALSYFPLTHVSKTFLPAQDFGEFSISLDLPPGTTLEKMNDYAKEIDTVIQKHKEIASSVLIVGDGSGTSNVATFYINLVGAKQRSMNTSEFKEIIRNDLKPFAESNPKVKDIDMVGGGQSPFMLNVIGTNLEELEKVSKDLSGWLKNHPSLKDVDTNSRPGKPEIQVNPNQQKAEQLGVLTSMIGQELRFQVEGVIPAKLRKEGLEYDIRMRVQEDQRDIRKSFNTIMVPNMNQTLVPLKNFASMDEAIGPATITRQDRTRYVAITADMNPAGPGMGLVMKDIEARFNSGVYPKNITYDFSGEAENFQELFSSILIAAVLAVMFIYLIMASLYESFITPFTLMLVLPLAACGAFYALYIANGSLDIFSMIGCIMLLGVAMKNSIILVDYTQQLLKQGKILSEAIVEAASIRLRPILMTTLALIAGMFPLALGLNEASRQRTSMGIAVIGGLITSTVLSLLIVPAAYSYIERFRAWSLQLAKKIFGYHTGPIGTVRPTVVNTNSSSVIPSEDEGSFKS